MKKKTYSSMKTKNFNNSGYTRNINCWIQIMFFQKALKLHMQPPFKTTWWLGMV
jgi:hypothetical protein